MILPSANVLRMILCKYFDCTAYTLIFVQLVILSEADTFKSTSILIYSNVEQSIYTQMRWHDATLIYTKFKAKWRSLSLNEI